jgi:hypothetical protein
MFTTISAIRGETRPIGWRTTAQCCPGTAIAHLAGMACVWGPEVHEVSRRHPEPHPLSVRDVWRDRGTLIALWIGLALFAFGFLPGIR